MHKMSVRHGHAIGNCLSLGGSSLSTNLLQSSSGFRVLLRKKGELLAELQAAEELPFALRRRWISCVDELNLSVAEAGREIDFLVGEFRAAQDEINDWLSAWDASQGPQLEERLELLARLAIQLGRSWRRFSRVVKLRPEGDLLAEST